MRYLFQWEDGLGSSLSNTLIKFVMDLFDIHGASFSIDRKYRYALWRIWEPTKPRVMFIGLNPSTANEETNDPTINSVRRISISNGYGGFYMLNLFGVITPKPAELKKCDNPVGNNDEYLWHYHLISHRICFAWGAFDVYGRDREIIKQFPNAMCLGKNNDGSPRHPLFLKGITEMIKFKP